MYQFLSYSSEAQFDSFKARFYSISAGFSELTDRAILNIQPVKLKLVTAQRTAAFSDLLPAKLPMDIKPEEVAIINQVSLNDQIQKGTTLKIPVQ